MATHATSFFFYDLETSGISPRDGRIMQFAGQRTDMALQPVGEPVNVLIKLTPDVLPEPDAILVTGITPQQTLADGVTEAEFLQQFTEQVATPGTIFVGYNTVRFDDEFMRFLHYRNFYDPYQWQWQDGRSRWDLLDVVRMTRALRPDGIEWPFAPDGKHILTGSADKTARLWLTDVHDVIKLACSLLRRDLIPVGVVEPWLRRIQETADPLAQPTQDRWGAAINAESYLRALHLQLTLAAAPPADRADLLLVLLDVLRVTNAPYLAGPDA